MKRFIAWLRRHMPRRVRWNGYPRIRGRKIRRAIRIAQAHGLVVTSTTGGTHSSTSWHYQGRAVDVASSSVTKMKQAQIAIARDIGRENFLELFGPGSWYIKNGEKIKGAFPDHGDHIHIAI